MSNVWLTNSIRLITLWLFQVLILNQIELHGFISPMLYPLAILLLPFETPVWAVMLLGFALGLGVDLFANSIGIHAAATVAMAYLRSHVIHFNRPISGYEPQHYPTWRTMGFGWFIIYMSILFPLHHLVYFILDVYSFSFLTYTLLKTVGSAVVSIVLVLVYMLLFRPRR